MTTKALAVIGLLILAQGCAVTKVPVATGGSRADGIVAMSYEYGSFESPQVDWTKAQQEAAQRCAAWGYSSAEPFGGSTTQCNGANGYGCNHWIVTMQYQCLE